MRYDGAWLRVGGGATAARDAPGERGYAEGDGGLFACDGIEISLSRDPLALLERREGHPAVGLTFQQPHRPNARLTT